MDGSLHSPGHFHGCKRWWAWWWRNPNSILYAVFRTPHLRMCAHCKSIRIDSWSSKVHHQLYPKAPSQFLQTRSWLWNYYAHNASIIFRNTYRSKNRNNALPNRTRNCTFHCDGLRCFQDYSESCLDVQTRERWESKAKRNLACLNSW